MGYCKEIFIKVDVWGFLVGGYSWKPLTEATVGVIGVTSLELMVGGCHCRGSLIGEVTSGRPLIRKH